jgi:hypothetical protein
MSGVHSSGTVLTLRQQQGYGRPIASVVRAGAFAKEERFRMSKEDEGP